nr:putative ribonuclease H-like domain-containing protein [Tanacetum cinerariifolium]
MLQTQAQQVMELVKKGRTVTLTTDDIQKRKNDVKARTTLLLSLPDEHQLRFSKYKTAQELWAAILKTFGGNEATKKTKKNLLKQQYGNFKVEGSKTLEQTFNRLQRNKSDLDTMSLDDLYNHLKVYESKVQKKSESNSQNMAFISSPKHNNRNEEVNTASVSTASTNVSPASTNIGVASISQETACTYIASQSSGSQTKFKDINQIDEDDIEEMDIKWNTTLLSMRADRFWKKIGKKISIEGTDVAGFDKSKVECFNFHKMDEEAPTEFALMTKTSAESEVFDNSLCSKACKKNSDSLNNDAQNKNPSVTETKASLSTISPKPFIKFVKENDSPTKSKTDKVETAKKPAVKKFSTVNRKFPTVNRKFPTGSTKISTADMGSKGKAVKASGSSQNNIDDKGYWDNGCSRHMASNISYLSYYEPFNGGYVSFGQRGCKITGKGTIKTGKLEFENVYFMKDLKYNLFSVSQICDSKNSVLFTDSECIVLGRNFKLLDDTNVLLRNPRQHNMYSIDLNNIVPHKDLTCLVAKASADECMIWHRRLGHLNFKTMNRLVRHNLVRGLPFKCFENDHTCIACLKGKHHKASCKSKLVNSVTKPLHTLHMDLFGPTSVSSLSHKWYCLVVTDDFSRFTWTFFLKTKDESSGILRRFITKIENLKDLKVKIIRVLVNKSHNKTPYELFNGRSPAIGFLKPFGCHVMIFNTLDNLRKFNAKGNKGYFIGYSMTSKAFRVFNKRAKRVEENLHVEFLENKAIEKGTKDAASQEVKKDVSSLRYIALPNWVHDTLLESSSSKPQDVCSTDVPESSGNLNPTATLTNPPTDQMETLTVETPIPTVSSPVPTACFTDSQEPSSDTRLISKRVANQVETPSLDNILTLTNRFEDIHGVTTNSDESNGVEADVLKNKKDERGIVIKNKARLVAQGHTQEYGIDYDKVFAHVARIEAIRLFLAYASFMGFTVYQMDVKSAFLYGTIDEEVEVPVLSCYACHERLSLRESHHLLLDFCDYHNMVAILEKSEHNFWSTARIETTEDGTKILATVNGILRTIIESSLRRNLKLKDKEGISSLPDAELFENLRLMGYNISPNQKFTFQKGQFSHQWKYLIHTIMQCLSPKSTGFNEFSSNIDTALVCLATNRVYNFSKMIFDEAQQTSHTPHSLPTLPPVITTPIPIVTLSDTPHLRQYTRRARIAQSSALPPVADEPASPLRNVSQGEACLTVSSLEAEHDRANIDKTSILPHESTSRVPSLAADDGHLQLQIQELMDLCTSLQRIQTDMVSKFEAQELEITRLKDKIKLLEDKDEGDADQYGDDDPIKGRRMNEGEEAAKRVSDDTEEMVTVLTSMDAASILTSGGVQVVPTAAAVATATIQEQMDIQMARQLEEEMERDAQRMNEKITRDTEIARIHTKEELQIMIDGLGRKEIKENFDPVWKQINDFIPIGSKEEAERFKRKGIRFEQESVKKLKTLEEVKTTEEVPEEKVKEMIQLIPVEEVYVEAFKSNNPLLTGSIMPPTSDKEMEIWVELKRLYEPDAKDQLWTHTQNIMHAPVEWKLYDSCGVHHVTFKDKEIFMLVEKDYPLRKGLAIMMISYKL